MTTTYTVIKNTAGETLSIRRNDGASIPVCEGNSDYQQYLADVDNHGPYPIEVIPDPEPSTQPTIADLQEQLAATNAILLDMYLGI